MSALTTIDLVLVACIVAGAATYLAWALLGHRAAPACHAPAATRARKGGLGGGGADVVVGAALQRGLDRARARAGGLARSRG
jgi:hypothetical protein